VADDQAPVFEFDGQWPFSGTVRVAGHEVASITAFDIHAAPDEVPAIRLTLVGAGALRLLLSTADVRIPDETRQALIALGWTPPAS
jgi:hypothetical protein